MQGIKQVDERSKVKLNKWAQLEGPKTGSTVDGHNGSHTKLVGGGGSRTTRIRSRV